RGTAPTVRYTRSLHDALPICVYWKDAGVTKEGLASWYTQVWHFMAPHVVNRPLALLRCPGGTAAQCFFQKHAWKGMGKEIVLARSEEHTSELQSRENLVCRLL